MKVWSGNTTMVIGLSGGGTSFPGWVNLSDGVSFAFQHIGILLTDCPIILRANQREVDRSIVRRSLHHRAGDCLIECEGESAR